MWRLGRWRYAVSLAVALGAPGCSFFRREVKEPSPPPASHAQVGVASWYGADFQGDRTASGERFDAHAFSAAHRSLPLGTRVKVTNLANARSVYVRINDRGPFVRGRTIDVSYAAARALDMVGSGTARVRIEVIGTAPEEATARVARSRRSRGHVRRQSRPRRS